MVDDCAFERRVRRGGDIRNGLSVCGLRGGGAGRGGGRDAGGLSRGARGAGAAGPPGSRARPSSRRGIPQPAGGRHAMRADTRTHARAAARRSPGVAPPAQCEGRVAGASAR